MNPQFFSSFLMLVLGTGICVAQSTYVENDLTTAVSQAQTALSSESQQDSTAQPMALLPLWKQKLYYGYNFDIYYHQDSRSNTKENGWSVSLTPEIGWRVKERLYVGLRLGGSYQDSYTTLFIGDPNGAQLSQSLRIRQGAWEVTPYGRYRLKTLFNDKVGVWLEAHLYAGMQFPRVTDGDINGTDYAGLRHNIVYGAQVAPVITYQFNKKSTLQLFFSIISFGYSGTTYCYADQTSGKRYNEHTNDVIIFSGRLRNLLNNQFTPGLYGLKFGVMKSL